MSCSSSSYAPTDNIAPRHIEAEVKRVMSRSKGLNLLFERSSEFLPIRSAEDILPQSMLYVAQSHKSPLTDPAQIWDHFFVHQTPMSEPCRVIMTLMNRCGLRSAIDYDSYADANEDTRRVDMDQWKATVRSSVLNVGHHERSSSICIDDHPSFEQLDQQTSASTNAYLRIVRSNTIHVEGAKQVLLDCVNTLEAKNIVVCVEHFDALTVVAEFLQQSCEAIVARGHRVFLWSLNFSLYGSLVHLSSTYHVSTNLTLIVPWIDTSLNSFYSMCKDIIEQVGMEFVVCPYQNSNEEINFVHWMHIKSALTRIISEKYRIIVFCGHSVTPRIVCRDARMLLSGPPKSKRPETKKTEPSPDETTAANWGDRMVGEN